MNSLPLKRLVSSLAAGQDLLVLLPRVLQWPAPGGPVELLVRRGLLARRVHVHGLRTPPGSVHYALHTTYDILLVLPILYILYTTVHTMYYNPICNVRYTTYYTP